ncbi:MAG: hypothetical protein IJX46_03770 [Clostridia bacterium]|nr:hypothetical protein [Clostridia bacterium]
MRRALFGLLFAALILIAFTLPCYAAEEIEIGYGEFVDELPNTLVDRLPSGDWGSDPSSDATSLVSWEHVSAEISEILGLGLGASLRILAVLMGLILISAAARSLCASFGGRSAALLELCTAGAVCAAAISLQYEILLGAADYLADLTLLMNAMLPVTVSLYAAGGNVATAGVSAGAFGIFLNLSENILATTVVPFSGICLAFALVGSMSGGLDLRSISGTFKRIYSTALSFIMMLFSAVMAAQTILASASDSISLRATKFVAGSVIPVLGGSVSESVKTLAAGIGALRKSVGICGIALIALLFLPVLVSLLLTRAVNGIAASFANMLGCDREGALLAELSSVYGYICGVLAVCSITFIFTLIMLINTGVAIQ